MSPRIPWSIKLSPEEEGRAERTARALGMVDGEAVCKSELLRAGLDAMTARAIRRRMVELGGLAKALDTQARGLRALLLDVLAICQDDERALLRILGANEAEWMTALLHYPEVAREAQRLERAKAPTGDE